MGIDDLVNTRLAVVCTTAAEYAAVDDLLRAETDVDMSHCSAVSDSDARCNPYYFVDDCGCPSFESTIEELKRQYGSIARSIGFSDFMAEVMLEENPMSEVDLPCMDVSAIL